MPLGNPRAAKRGELYFLILILILMTASLAEGEQPFPGGEGVDGAVGGGDVLLVAFGDHPGVLDAGFLHGGATLSLIQGNTDDDALNILIGDVYDGYGYMFTVELFGGYFIKDAMALGMHAGYSRTWFDIDLALMEDLLDVAEERKYV